MMAGNGKGGGMVEQETAETKASEGEAFVAGLPRVTAFHDRSKRRSHALARLVAARLIDDPGLAASGLDHVRRHMETDPRQAPYAAAWRDLLARDPREVARRLLADSPEGDLLRDTQPVIYVPTPDELAGIAAETRPDPIGSPRP